MFNSSGLCSLSSSSGSSNELVSPNDLRFKEELALEHTEKWWSSWESGILALKGVWDLLKLCAGEICKFRVSLESILGRNPKPTPICKLKNWLFQILQNLTGKHWPITHNQLGQGKQDDTLASDISISSSIQDQPRFELSFNSLSNRRQPNKDHQESLNSVSPDMFSEKEERQLRVRFADVPSLQRKKSFRSGLNLSSTHEEPDIQDQLESTKRSVIDFLCKDEGYEYYSKGGGHHQEIPIWSKSNIFVHLREYLLSGDLGAEVEVKKQIIKEKLKKMVILFIDGNLYDVTLYSSSGQHPGGMKILRQYSILRKNNQTSNSQNPTPQEPINPGTASSSTSHNSPGVGHNWFPGYSIDWIESSPAFHYDLNQHSWMAKHKLKQFLISKISEDF
ncbi:uncharacterized protein MELLADRAFT_104651 [Melampsora larici-populina 98AG31]|uniref:Cytochrome b5 heme-binding domain-containing protein n=1 Tax=Melampsora larici-populina (strain 98AG31 / pathotype 3-4-7) TaxID=747676 RepID=F4RFF9_MELLP|nr:uncharacterized protein MELLADRAFT_104651 [Melampsora larici-populina 98AG31]EGG08802.1 hypothetical protein MELLADRAFT_104651 [Melampsora larici-populina 98AG31]